MLSVVLHMSYEGSIIQKKIHNPLMQLRVTCPHDKRITFKIFKILCDRSFNDEYNEEYSIS